jgi:hypothetical protein
MKRDIHHILQDDNGGTSTGAVVSLAAATVETATVGTSADLKGYRSAEVVISIGAWTDGDNTYTITESDDDSTFSAVAAADLRGGANAIVVSGTATDNVVHLRGYVGNKRYIRVEEAASSTAGVPRSAVILRGHKANKGKLSS